MNIQDLERKASKIRRMVIETIGNAGAGHTGGSLSWVEIGTVLFFRILKIDPGNPGWEERDRFILSKGHASPTLYCCLAERGYFPVEKLKEFDRVNGMLQGHPDMRKTPGVDISTGALGQGLSVGIGMALGGRMRGLDFRVWVLLGDGEVQEGQVWEAASYAGFHKIGNLTAIIDYNRLQLCEFTDEILPVEEVGKCWEIMGWEVFHVDGHSIPALVEVMERVRSIKNAPTLIIAHTVKGKGISFMENRVEWHSRPPNREEMEKALEELRKKNVS